MGVATLPEIAGGILTAEGKLGIVAAILAAT